ncbi:MAG: acyltransferase [Chloroflexi bacterium]|nr:acyltransferase [Chloroflexota bacterium]
MSYFDSVVATSTYWSNIFFWRQTNYFGGAAEFEPLLHTWSLSIEEQYYLIYPVFMLLFWRLGKRNIVGVLGAAFVVSFGIGQWGSGAYPHASFYLLITRGWELLVGAFIALYLHRRSADPVAGLYTQIGSIIGLGMIVVSVFAFSSDTPVPSVYTLLPTVGTALVILFAVNGTFVNKVLSIRALVGVGLISYGAYLWHQPILAFGRHLDWVDSGIAFAVPVGVLVLILSYISYRYVERPFRNRSVVSARVVWFAAVASVLVFVGLSAATSMNDGFRGRFDSSSFAFLDDVEDNGEYVPLGFRSVEGAEFEVEGLGDKRRIVLVGDSFAMDVVNALQEGGSLDSIALSTHHISARCGNLYLDYSILDEVDSTDKGRCEREGWYTPETVELMRGADEIWLASSWNEDHLVRLDESLTNLERDFSASVVLFGTKLFWDGDKTFSQILDVFEDGDVVSVPDSAVEINQELQRIAESASVTFVDPMKLLCGESSTCDLHSSDSSTLITVDGGHLTKSGVRRFANRLPEYVALP